MKRRELLGGLFALSAAGLFSSCRKSEEPERDGSRLPEPAATLKVVLQGPFAVVFRKNEDRNHKITAFVPLDPLHEFRFQTPAPESVQNKSAQYRFILGGEGLQISSRAPYMDHGLDDMNFELGQWEPNEKAYFVSIDLPNPDLVTFIPPAEPVVFEGGRLAFAPLNHVLEYKIQDPSKILLHSEQLGDSKPLQFTEMFKHYEEHLQQEQDYKNTPGHGPQSKLTQGDLAPSGEPNVFTYFLGVGVRPGRLSPPEAVRHGLDFFNNKLVPSFPNSQNLKQLTEIRDYGQPCVPMGKGGQSSLRPSVLRDSVKPRLLLVTSAEDCRGPGLTGGCC